MAVTASNLESTRFPGSGTTATHAFPSSPAAGDTIVVVVKRSTGGNGGEQFAQATSAGYQARGHHQSDNNFRGIFTILTKTSDGTEVDVQLDWTPSGAEVDSESNVVVSSAFLSGGVGQIQVQFDDFVTTSGVSYPDDALDFNLHSALVIQDEDTSGTLYGPSDTQIAHSAIGFRNGGIAVSGGTGDNGPFTNQVTGTLATISFAEAGPTAQVTSITDGEELQPGTIITSITVDVDSPTSADWIDLTITRDSDGLQWDNATSSFTSSAVNSFSVTNALPSTEALAISGFDIGEGESYTLVASARETGQLSGASDEVGFSSGVWQYAEEVTFTSAAGFNSGTVELFYPGNNVWAPSPDPLAGNFNLVIEDGGVDIDYFEVAFNNLTTGFALEYDQNFNQVFSAPLDTLFMPNLGDAFPSALPFSAGSGISPQLVEGHQIEIKARAVDVNGAKTAFSSLIIDVALVSGAITSHGGGFVLPRDADEIVLSGTASSAPDSLQVSVNGHSVQAVDVGINFSQWEATVPLVDAGASEGSALTVQLLDSGVVLDSVQGRVNERPAATRVSGPDNGDLLPPNSALGSFGVAVSDDSDGISLISYRLTRSSDQYSWDGIAFVSGDIWNDSTATFSAVQLPATYLFQNGSDGIVLPQDLGADESYSLAVRVTDDSPVSDSRAATIASFATLPSVEATIDPLPASFAWTTDAVKVQGTGEGDIVEVRVNGGSWITAQGSTQWTATIPVSQGVNDVEARTSTAAGVTTQPADYATTSLTVETPPTSAPSLSITSHFSGGIIDSDNMVTVSGNATDLAGVEYRLGRRFDSLTSMTTGQAFDMRRPGIAAKARAQDTPLFPRGGVDVLWAFTFHAALRTLGAARERNLAGVWGNDRLWRIFIDTTGDIVLETQGATGPNAYNLGPFVGNTHDLDDMGWFRVDVDTAANTASLSISLDGVSWSAVSSANGSDITNAQPVQITDTSEVFFTIGGAGNDDLLNASMSLSLFSWLEGADVVMSLSASSDGGSAGDIALPGYTWVKLPEPLLPWSSVDRIEFDWWDGASFAVPSTALPATGSAFWSVELPDEIDVGSYYAIQVRGVDADGQRTPW